MGQFAIDVAIKYNIGSARENRSVLSAMDIGRDEFFASFGNAINDLILRHREDLEKKRKIRPGETDPKARWVDGTPEYSFYICGLRKLFPNAKFVHIVRDVSSVVRSMLNFDRLGAGKLVANEQEAYTYWLRTVNSCLLAERAYGPTVVFRLRYSDLVNAPENALETSLNFLGETFVSQCLNMLQTRINSSEVPADFEIRDSNTDPAVVEQATQLSRQLEEGTAPADESSSAANEMESAFNERVQYIATLDNQYQKALEVIRTLQTTKP